MYIGTPLNGFKLRFASNLDLMFKTRFQLKYVYAIDNFSEKKIHATRNDDASLGTPECPKTVKVVCSPENQFQTKRVLLALPNT